jgi:redox-sensitive bicupin YhaK (pirin superfamily)
MITLRKNTDRRHINNGKHDSWLTFYHQVSPHPPTDSFGVLTAFNEIRLPPGGVSAPHPTKEAEILTYAYQGALAQEDSTGDSGVVHAGEFQHMTIGRGIRHKETNPSLTDWAHVFRIYLRPSENGLPCAHEQKRFPGAQRHNVLCVVASPDGRKGSLRILQDSVVYSSIIDPGRHLIHELLPGRSAWVHVIDGEATLHDIILTQGDGAGVTIEPSVSVTAQENTEMLLMDLAGNPNASGPR